VPQLVVGDAVWLATPQHPRVLALYTKAPAATRNAVIVVHGLGVNPDWNLIGVLRTTLADQGFATLSVQMPVLAADAPRDDYQALFADAGERLTAAVAWLHDNGYAHVAVVSHSLGAAMVNAWLAQHDERVVDAWVPVGMFVAFASRPREPLERMLLLSACLGEGVRSSSRRRVVLARRQQLARLHETLDVQLPLSCEAVHEPRGDCRLPQLFHAIRGWAIAACSKRLGEVVAARRELAERKLVEAIDVLLELCV